MAKDKKESAALFRIMWELAKIDREPIQIGNTSFEPLRVDGPGFDVDRLLPAIAYLQTERPFQEAKGYLKSAKKSLAQEALKFHYPWLRTMRDGMWEELFRFLMNESDVSGISSQSSKKRQRPGPHSPKREAIWNSLDKTKIGSSLRNSDSLPSRQRLALKIGKNLEVQSSKEFFGAGSKPDADIMAVLRQFSQKKVARRRLHKRPS